MKKIILIFFSIWILTFATSYVTMLITYSAQPHLSLTGLSTEWHWLYKLSAWTCAGCGILLLFAGCMRAITLCYREMWSHK